MESQVCVHCLNKKPINVTTNRLVTERCGHVKCMDCLIHEEAGCVACAENKAVEPYGLAIEEQPSAGPTSENEVPQTIPPPNHIVLEENSKESQLENLDEGKKKLDMSHIKIIIDENGRSYECKCGRKFQARSQVAYHAYCNGQRKPYECPECNKSFKTHSHFKYHMRVHRNERTYACELCGDSFFQMSKLQRHKLKHTKEKKYQCTECSKAFNNLTSLRKHGLTHTEERPHGCKVCGRRFRDSSNLRKHLAKHNNSGCVGGCACGACGRRARAARAHQCPRCPQAFHARKDMRRHAAVHDDSKPFRCKVCSRRFRRKDNLERHIRNTHPDHAPASAVVCDEPGPPTTPKKDFKKLDLPEKIYQTNEKIKLEILNPLPPLPPEVIQKHMHEKDEESIVDQAIKEKMAEKSLADKIIEANNARQSVIFGPVRRDVERASSPKENEYVHKIRKANVMASCRRDVPLPPIDVKKIAELERMNHQNNLDVGAPPEKFRELYKKILYERSEKEAAIAMEEEKNRNTSPEKVHWRRKMKLNIN
ncbi:uncharacterized protein isoform X2 [Choristoneura fumiferana]|uniref:uncharacterized protein isoform X2 n=1 Tax=Choristoneura fumiferana TaxID=7141 RepID=UPI003D15A118